MAPNYLINICGKKKTLMSLRTMRGVRWRKRRESQECMLNKYKYNRLHTLQNFSFSLVDNSQLFTAQNSKNNSIVLGWIWIKS